MSGAGFGALMSGISSGYQFGNAIKNRKKPEPEDAEVPVVETPSYSDSSFLSKGMGGEPDEVAVESNERTWEMIRSMADNDTSLDLSQPQQSGGGGSSLNPGMLKSLMGSGGGGAVASSAGGGLGGSGLIGSSGGAVSAGANGGASFGLGGSLVGGSGTVGRSTFAASGGSGAGASAGGGLAAAGPWAALAAIIGLNEEHSRKKGLRAEDRGERAQDMLTGKVLTQDIEGKWGPKLDKMTGGKASSLGFTGDMKGASQIGSFRFGKGLKTLWNEGTIGKIRKKL